MNTIQSTAMIQTAMTMTGVTAGVPETAGPVPMPSVASSAGVLPEQGGSSVPEESFLLILQEAVSRTVSPDQQSDTQVQTQPVVWPGPIAIARNAPDAEAQGTPEPASEGAVSDAISEDGDDEAAESDSENELAAIMAAARWAAAGGAYPAVTMMNGNGAGRLDCESLGTVENAGSAAGVDRVDAHSTSVRPSSMDSIPQQGAFAHTEPAAQLGGAQRMSGESSSGGVDAIRDDAGTGEMSEVRTDNVHMACREAGAARVMGFRASKEDSMAVGYANSNASPRAQGANLNTPPVRHIDPFTDGVEPLEIHMRRAPSNVSEAIPAKAGARPGRQGCQATTVPAEASMGDVAGADGSHGLQGYEPRRVEPGHAAVQSAMEAPRDVRLKQTMSRRAESVDARPNGARADADGPTGKLVLTASNPLQNARDAYAELASSTDSVTSPHVDAALTALGELTPVYADGQLPEDPTGERWYGGETASAAQGLEGEPITASESVQSRPHPGGLQREAVAKLLPMPVLARRTQLSDTQPRTRMIADLRRVEPGRAAVQSAMEAPRDDVEVDSTAALPRAENSGIPGDARSFSLRQTMSKRAEADQGESKGMLRTAPIEAASAPKPAGVVDPERTDGTGKPVSIASNPLQNPRDAYARLAMAAADMPQKLATATGGSVMNADVDRFSSADGGERADNIGKADQIGPVSFHRENHTANSRERSGGQTEGFGGHSSGFRSAAPHGAPVKRAETGSERAAVPAAFADAVATGSPSVGTAGTPGVEASSTAGARGERLSPEVGESVMTQISAHLRARASRGSGEFRAKLVPENLGDVEIRIRVIGDSCTATIKVQNPEVERYVSEHGADLKASLAEHGMDLGGLAVSVGFGFASGRDDGNAARDYAGAFYGNGERRESGASAWAGAGHDAPHRRGENPRRQQSAPWSAKGATTWSRYGRIDYLA
ncbi:MAG: flagellar hook-length control protein FliK [Clostridia bacterium]|nr:flagellar hook-length control protein FliK [Clostridia bacterium]